MNKYHSKKITRDGETFDSVKEYRRWCELQLLVKANVIQDLKKQVEFLLIPAQYENGKCIERAVKYRADFVYTENGKTIVEDTKGFKTKDYIIKRKLMYYIHKIRIKEI